MAQSDISSGFDTEHYWEFVTFSVGGCLFRVPKYRFIEDSDYFSSKFNLGGKLEQEYGLDDPLLGAITLDVDVQDFRTFLKVLYPRNSDDSASFTSKEWQSVLKISTMWLFNDIRQRCLAQLVTFDLPVFERIALASEYNVASWLSSGYQELATRQESITLEEAEKLDVRKAIQLYQIREQIREGVHDPSDSTKPVESMIQQTFSADFGRLREMEQKYLTKAEKSILEAEAKAEGEVNERNQRHGLQESMARQEEEERQIALINYEQQMEEQRIKLASLEEERRQLSERPLTYTYPTDAFLAGAMGGKKIKKGKKTKTQIETNPM